MLQIGRNGSDLMCLHAEHHHVCDTEIGERRARGDAFGVLALVLFDQREPALLDGLQMWAARDDRNLRTRFCHFDRQHAADGASTHDAHFHTYLLLAWRRPSGGTWAQGPFGSCCVPDLPSL